MHSIFPAISPMYIFTPGHPLPQTDHVLQQSLCGLICCLCVLCWYVWCHLHSFFCSVWYYTAISLVRVKFFAYASCIFSLLSLPLFSISFLRHLRSNGVAALFLAELKATSSAWRDVMQISPLDCSYCWHIYFNSCSSSFFLFCFVNLKSWRVSEHIVRFCCLCFSLPADASVLLPIWSVPYLNNSAVQTHCLSSVQCTAESTNPTDCTASRYLRPFSFLHLLTVPFADETHWLCFNCELKNSGESWWLFSLTVCWKLRNSLLGHTKQ